MKFEKFKDLISVTDYNVCESKMDKHPTWYFSYLGHLRQIFVQGNSPFFYAYVFFFSFSFIRLHSFLFVLERVIQRNRYYSKVVL